LFLQEDALKNFLPKLSASYTVYSEPRIVASYTGWILASYTGWILASYTVYREPRLFLKC